jgi:probable HAF family extracellular repeat protein
VLVLDMLGETAVESRAFGINNFGEVVGEVDLGAGNTRAVIWLYCPRFGLTARLLHDLSDLADTTGSGTVSTARDVNDAGIAVGDEEVASERWPMIWRLPEYVPSSSTGWTERLQPFSGSSLSGRANAVNNESPAVVVGTASLDVQCGLSIPRSEVAFKHTISGSDTPLGSTNFLGGEFSNDNSKGWDVSTGHPALACGEILECGSTVSPCTGSGAFDGVTWEVLSDDVAVLSDAGTTRGAVALGINDAGQIVGWFETGDEACRQRAGFWEDSTAAVVDLGGVGFGPTEETYANRIGPLKSDGSVEVVGRAVIADNGILWTRDTLGTWSHLDLQDQISPLCDIDFREATDINADGWIVGIGERSGVEKAILLRPLPCPADLDGDCVVGGSDLGLLLAELGFPSSDCAFDLELDGVIDSADLGLLLANWECTCEPPCEEESEAQTLSAGSAPSLQFALLVLGFADVQAFNEWCESASEESVEAALGSLLAILLSELDSEQVGG